ncbi:hypothetical protein Trydic_g13077 [Trypoxylus dichotomus]
MNAFNRLGNRTKVTMAWVQGHEGHRGNVKADEARAGPSVEKDPWKHMGNLGLTEQSACSFCQVKKETTGGYEALRNGLAIFKSRHLRREITHKAVRFSKENKANAVDLIKEESQ